MNWDINYAGWVGLLLIIVCSCVNQVKSTICCRGEVCNKTTEIAKRLMCPEFPEYGPIRPLHESCHLYNVAYLFDNDLTVIFALFMSLWATVFMEMWKRRQSVLVWEWDLEMDEQEEQTRPEFEVSNPGLKLTKNSFLPQANVKTTRINPVTKHPEPFLSGWNKAGRLIFTSSFVVFLVRAILMLI